MRLHALNQTVVIMLVQTVWNMHGEWRQNAKYDVVSRIVLLLLDYDIDVHTGTLHTRVQQAM